MIELNLSTSNHEQEKIKAYLQNNVSDVLAEKINNGVQIVKDGKKLLNKKDLTTFMAYAEEQVLNLITENERKGRQVRCIDDDTVYAWAIHYFEENSIEGKLYNADGTEYAPPKPVNTTKPTPTVPYTPPAPKPKPQLSIFDMVNDSTESTKPVSPSANVIVEQPKIEQKQGSPMYLHYLSVKEQYNDCIVFYRLGDFYEMFGDDAKISADVLNLTLTGRDCGLNERVPMTGVPFHAAESYITKLVSAGYKVAVCEPLEGTNDRTVNRVITKNSESKQIIDVETGEIIPEELSVDEMQKFDGDIEEPEEIPTISKILEGVDMGDDQDTPDDDFDLEQERERLKAFDKNAIIILSDLLGNIFTLE